MNCSGKHAAMLLACVANDWPLEGYLDPEHPLQKRILDVLERFTGERPAATAVDGCGAPVHAISLRALARGIQKITTAASSSPFALYREAAALTEAARENAWAVGGPGQPDTVAMERLGVFAKVGAEGVMVMTAPNGTTTALKVLDGSSRASTIIALRLLADAGAVAGRRRRRRADRARPLGHGRRASRRPGARHDLIRRATDAAPGSLPRGIRRRLGSGQPSFASRFARAARETCAPITSTSAKRNTADAMTLASAGMPREAEM